MLAGTRKCSSCLVRGPMQINPTMFESGARLRRRIADLPAFGRKKGA